MPQSPHNERDRGRFPVSRRSFLSGSGISAASTIMLDKALPDLMGSDARAAEQEAVGPERISIQIDINGVSYPLTVAPNMTLADALRDVLGLTGTKIGCDRGACSACTVWLDGAPIAACMMLAVDVGSRKITTIEGLARGSALHPVQSAFIAHDAVQCGYCTPGLVMSCAALLQTNPNPTRDDIKSAISGHLCRCGTYPHVIAAVLDVASNRKT